MSVPALLRFAPAYDPRAFLEGSSGAPELMVAGGALKKVRPDAPTPVVVDHDLGRIIGHVRETYVLEDVDYGTRVRKWWFASCELDEVPGWLKRGSAVSWSYKTLHARSVAETEVLETCLIEEISVLTPSTSPAEPLARVAWLGEREHSPSVLPSDGAGGEVIDHGRGVLVRRENVGQVLGLR